MRLAWVCVGVLATVGWGLGVADAAEWRLYQDQRFGTATLYRADILPERKLTPSGATFYGAGGSLEISAAPRDIYSVEQLRALIAQTPGYDDVTYSPAGQNWLVVSGFRGGEIFYEKYFVRDGIVEGFALEYPTAARRTFDPLVERIEDSFRPGR